ncbi:adenine-specific DNA-methyltransferase [Hymenobacter luteus]|uniref:Adenine-specific DNA-methyltransferase n=2 Tax=Hymenobacter TaxID=89966 RepID=A0A7W9W9U4_9BACT|nr:MULTISPECIES: site-specific DNA-methyltransferase [Hymenobacter]MBB4600442.1 adenine-specific DNA-methyltransferase [Hymenobacter latericoloratus]MBB6057248.1 adenine-specific DNA-methyltransferase [Hymenobacter luteus]
MPDKATAAYHHRDQRPLIPSEAEAGAEQINPKVQHHATKVLDKDPIIHRGQDPHLNWLGKYDYDDPEQRPDYLRLDIRSLYRHEHVRPEALMQRLYRQRQAGAPQLDLFGPSYQDVDELDKPLSYYQHHSDWENRLILGDSLAVMTSLLEREGLNGQVQMVYLDPPYGIKYGSNWQIKLNNRTVQDGKDEHLSSEPEQIKAFRDTWELGIHSYLSYLRNRLLVARELLTESGSCFVQISDENVHLVRNLMDEVFGAGNFVAQISYKTTTSTGEQLLESVADYIIWYARAKTSLKYRQLYNLKVVGGEGGTAYGKVELVDGTKRSLTAEERADIGRLPLGAQIYRIDNLTSQRGASGTDLREFHLWNKVFTPGKGTFKTDEKGLRNLAAKNRLEAVGTNLYYRRYFNDFPVFPISNIWNDTSIAGFASDKKYIVETSAKVIQRCMLMCTDPGDLVLDPTCGSGTTAYVAEQWGRRWITIDTSRIALNIAKTRLMTAAFPYYKLYDESGQDLRQGFIYKEVPHITLKSLANDEPPATEKLYDQPEEDKKRLRVAGPFTVETLQSLNPVAPEEVTAAAAAPEELESQQQFEQRVFAGLTSAGIRNGAKNEHAVFLRVEQRASPSLPAEGYWRDAGGHERKAYFLLGPRFGTVSKSQVNEAVRECRQLGDADWLVLLGFAFDDSIENREQTFSAGTFQVTRVRIGEDLLQEGLLKKDKKAASFVTIGEPEIAVVPAETPGEVCVEVRGLDIWDPIHNRLAARSVEDIAYWMLDDDYDGSNFLVRQVFFCGGEKTEFRKWRQKLDNQASATAKKRAEAALRVELDEDAWARLYGFRSHPIPQQKGRRVAVRVISQFGEESTRVLPL